MNTRGMDSLKPTLTCFLTQEKGLFTFNVTPFFVNETFFNMMNRISRVRTNVREQGLPVREQAAQLKRYFLKLRRNLWRSTSQSLGHVNKGRNYTRKVSACSNLSGVSYCDNCETCPEIGRYTGYFAPFQLIPNKFPTYVFVITVE